MWQVRVFFDKGEDGRNEAYLRGSTSWGLYFWA